MYKGCLTHTQEEDIGRFYAGVDVNVVPDVKAASRRL